MLTFLAAWTAALHSAGYLSGVYSSSASGITDLVKAQGTAFTEPDEVWFAHWNDAHTVSDSYIPSSDWANHQRIHQFSGDVTATYGGVTLNIDGDYLDGPAAPVGGPAIPDGTFIELANGTVTAAIYRVAGGAPLPVNNLTAFGNTSQYVRTVSQPQFNTLNAVPADGTFLTTTTGKIFRVAGGTPFPVSSWDVYGGPRAAVTVDQWAIDNLKLPDSHLHAFPASGTIVQGLPSGRDWEFTRTGRYALTGTPNAAVTVDDLALAPYRIVRAPLPGCKVPRLTGLALTAREPSPDSGPLPPRQGDATTRRAPDRPVIRHPPAGHARRPPALQRLPRQRHARLRAGRAVSDGRASRLPRARSARHGSRPRPHGLGARPPPSWSRGSESRIQTEARRARHRSGSTSRTAPPGPAGASRAEKTAGLERRMLGSWRPYRQHWPRTLSLVTAWPRGHSSA